MVIWTNFAFWLLTYMYESPGSKPFQNERSEVMCVRITCLPGLVSSPSYFRSFSAVDWGGVLYIIATPLRGNFGSQFSGEALYNPLL
jgi:hypothetical protein